MKQPSDRGRSFGTINGEHRTTTTAHSGGGGATASEIISQRLAALSARIFGQRIPVRWERMTGGVSTTVYCATRGDERFYLRVLPEEGATFALEARAHRLARSLGCAVPEVLAYEACDPVFERSTMLTTEIPGRPLSAEMAPTESRRIVMAAGRDLARINSIPVDGFGWINRDSDNPELGLSAEHPTLSALLDAEYRPIIERFPEHVVPGLADEELRTALETAIDIVGSHNESRLAHGDFDTSHIFVDDGRYSGIIDFGEIRGMPPCYDLGHHRMHDAERLPYSTLGWLLEGYAEVAPLPDDAPHQIRSWSLLIAARALWRGLERDPGSQIVATARSSLLRDVADT